MVNLNSSYQFSKLLWKLAVRSLPGFFWLSVIYFHSVNDVSGLYSKISNFVFSYTAFASVTFGALYFPLVLLGSGGGRRKYRDTFYFYFLLLFVAASLVAVLATTIFDSYSVLVLAVIFFGSYQFCIELLRSEHRFTHAIFLMYVNSISLSGFLVFLKSDFRTSIMIALAISSMIGISFIWGSRPKQNRLNKKWPVRESNIAIFKSISTKGPEALPIFMVRKSAEHMADQYRDIFLLCLDVFQRILGAVFSSVRFYSTPHQAEEMRGGFFRVHKDFKFVFFLLLVLIISGSAAIGILSARGFLFQENFEGMIDLRTFSLALFVAVAISLNQLRKYVFDIYFMAINRFAMISGAYLIAAASVYLAPFPGVEINFAFGFALSITYLFVFLKMGAQPDQQNRGLVFLTVSPAGGGAEKAAQRLQDEYRTEDRAFTWCSVLQSKCAGVGWPDVSLGGSRVGGSIAQIYRFLNHNKGSIIYSNLTYLNVVVCLLWKMIPFKSGTLVCVEHNIFFYEAEDRRIYPRGRLLTLIAVLVYRCLRINVRCVSEGVLSDCKALGISSAKLWLNPKPKVDRLLSVVPAHSRINFATVGALSKQKNIEEAILGFMKFKLDNPSSNSKLYVIGSGPNRDHLAMKARELGVSSSIYFVGHCEKPYHRLKELNVRTVLITSRWEGYCLVVEEAIAAGFDVIASDCKFGPAWIIRQMGVGTVYPLNNTERLAAAMQRSYDSSFNPCGSQQLPKQINLSRGSDAIENEIKNGFS